MELALIEKIIALFLMLFAGFILVKKDILKKEDSQSLSKLCLYLISPCVLFHAFTVEVTPERQKAFFLCGILALGIQGFFTFFIFLLDKFFPITVVEKTAVIYSNCGNIIIPIVAYALGEDYLIYITAYIGVYNILLWTHGISLFKKQQKKMGREGSCLEENFRDSEEASLFQKLSGFLKNPNILAIIFGFLCFSFRIDLPRPLGQAIKDIGGMIGPVSMMVTGMVLAKMPMENFFKNKRLFFVTFLRMVFFPLCLLFFFKLGNIAGRLPMGKEIFLVTYLSAIAPSGTSVNQFAIIYQQDAEYASCINIFTTLVAILTMPLFVYLYSWLI